MVCGQREHDDMEEFKNNRFECKYEFDYSYICYNFRKGFSEVKDTRCISYDNSDVIQYLADEVTIVYYKTGLVEKKDHKNGKLWSYFINDFS